ncbi:MAG TPA: RNase adapter RapZ [Stellaceae bacterium]|nr:RNase adapter RapZ [Stellaceae bacterium]
MKPSASPTIDPKPLASAGGRLLVVTGMSGAGRSTALKALEDMGYEAVDNLPLSLLPNLLSTPTQRPPLALGVDVRTRDFGVSALLNALDRLVAEHRLDLRIVFLDCEDDRLVRRYTETRRRHPLAGDRPVRDGIDLERQRVSPLRGRADLVVDTTTLTPGDLKRVLHGHYALDAALGITLFVTSFSYRQGVPRDADLVFDVRFLRNPHYVPALRPLTGLDSEVGAFIEADDDFKPFFERLCGLLAPLLPRFEREGKSYLTIAVGCTGGRHRSVYLAERLATWLSAEGRPVGLSHRDLDQPAMMITSGAIGAAERSHKDKA